MAGKRSFESFWGNRLGCDIVITGQNGPTPAIPAASVTVELEPVLQEIQELAPSILFPAKAPAGWDLDAFPSDGSRTQHAAQVDHWGLAQERIRNVSASLFIQAFADGLSPSEAADVVLQNADYISARENYIHWCNKESPGPRQTNLSAKQCFPEKLWRVSLATGRLLEKAMRLQCEVNGICEFLDSMPNPPTIPTSVSPERRQSEPLWFLSDPMLPDPVVRGMLASHRAYAMMATLDGLVNRPKWNLALIAAAAKLLVDEDKRYLGLLASVPETAVPETLVPLTDRFDLQKAIAAQRSIVADLRHTAA
jgi:hypothetical protein